MTGPLGKYRAWRRRRLRDKLDDVEAHYERFRTLLYPSERRAEQRRIARLRKKLEAT